jgi:EAL domain-containing protein (putative c-di-GMP-specific phosphodiesterase class I)
VDKRYLSIEITESLGEMENDMIAQIAKRLHDQSFHLSMDDFGTKYSSISILSLMQFDELKLDRSMIHNLVENDTSKKVVKHMIAMCDDLGVKCIAEGVETEAQKDLLNSMDCQKVQGYLYNRPIPVEEFESLYLKVEE